ncbi:MAG: hypothetical protein MOB07_11545 [Acidobacteria bacterium]|nr:hypothetical protein [Acidobacteriota bacterium]
MIRASRSTLFRFLSFSLIGLLGAAMLYSVFVLTRRDTAAQEKSPQLALNKNRGKQEPTKCPACKQVDDHYVNIPYFSESGGMTSTLSLNNNMKEATEVKITVLNGKGESFEASPVTLQAESITRLSLKDLTRDARGDFNSGNIQIFYRGPALGVTSQVSVVSTRQRVSFESMASETMMFASSKLNGIAWVPDDRTQASVALTNVASSTLTVTATGGRDPNKKVKPIKLDPRETRVIDLKEFIDVRRGSSASALIRLEHDGAPGALITTGFALNEKTGFSCGINFVDPATVKSSRLAGARLRFGKANDKEGFPSGATFRAPLVIANVSDVPTDARISVEYTVESGHNRVDLEPIMLAAREIKEIDLTREMEWRGVSGPVDNAGVDIIYSGAAGSVIGRLASVDASGDFCFEVPIKDPLSGVNRVGGSYPWRLDQGYTSILHLKNTIGETVYAMVQLRYAGGTYHLERIKLEPYQTVAVDIKQLRDAQQKDIRGGIMPKDLIGGKVVWFEEKIGSLIGRAEVTRLNAGVASSFSCGGYCPCPPNYGSSEFIPYSLLGPAGQYGNFTLLEMRSDPCDNTYGPYDRTNDALWSSSNPSVASIAGQGLVFCAAGGVCTITARFTAIRYEPQEGCLEEYFDVTPSGQAIVPVLSGPSSVTRGTPAGFTVENVQASMVSEWRFSDGTSTVNGPNGTLSWLGVMVTSGTISVKVTSDQSTTLMMNVTVNARANFAFAAAAAAEVSNGFNCAGSTITLPTPPTPQSKLGEFCLIQAFTFNTNTISGGPNMGYLYVTSASNSSGSTATTYSYVINPDLKNTGSAFYQAQCGNYHAQNNPNGFISGATLLSNTTHHEAGATQNSHYFNYKTAQDNSSNNLGVAAEMQVAPPGTAPNTFINNVTTILTNKRSTVLTAAQVEPCGVSDVRLDASCTFRGNINYPPYQACQ